MGPSWIDKNGVHSQEDVLAQSQRTVCVQVGSLGGLSGHDLTQGERGRLCLISYQPQVLGGWEATEKDIRDGVLEFPFKTPFPPDHG